MTAAPHFAHRGGVLLMTLTTLAALTLVAAYTMQRVSPKFQAAHQTAAWQEARLAAEAGVDAAMGDLVKNATGQTPGTWPGWKQQSGAPAGTVLAGLLSPVTNLLNSLLAPPSPGTTTTTSTAPIFLDNVNISAGSGPLTAVDVQLWGLRQTDTQRYWFRIRSMATCAIPPVAYKTAEKLDGPLRRLSLRQVRAQLGKEDVGDRMGIPAPSASRIVEVLVEPILPFELALWTDRALSLGTSGTWGVDSYDSRDPQKSAPAGTYPGHASPKVQEHGHVASNRGRPADALYGPLIAANGARVRGVVATNGGDDPATAEHENVAGAIALDPARVRDDFFREMKPPVRPASGAAWAAPLYGLPFVSGPDSAPTQYLVAGNLESLHIDARPAATQRAIIIMVNGDLDLREDVSIPPNVTALLYVRGNINFHDHAINTDADSSGRPAQLQIYGEDSGGDQRTLQAYGSAAIAAAFYGPTYGVLLSDNVDWCGSIAARSFEMRGGGTGGLHYDEALGRIGAPVSFRIARYIEDVRE